MYVLFSTDFTEVNISVQPAMWREVETCFYSRVTIKLHNGHIPLTAVDVDLQMLLYHDNCNTSSPGKICCFCTY